MNYMTGACVDCLKVEVHESRAAMGAAAASACRQRILEVLADQTLCRIIFAAAPSQSEMLAALRVAEGIPWPSVEAFHMDEYLGPAHDAPQRFANFLRAALFDHVPLRAAHLLDRGGLPLADEMKRYTALLSAAPIDIVCLGVGENGHIAFNDPAVADFADPVMIKEVELDETCRRQQVHDGAFARLEAVPTRAITLTVPALMQAWSLFCVVPGARKAAAVKAMLTGPIALACPASILRRHADCTLYLDAESASLWRESLP
jgi:glucosamine-6-phosphate deaminase